jgi:short-subunit dehydrogenase
MQRKLAVITGSNKGIGKSIAIEFASRDFDVVITGRNETDLHTVSNYISQKYQIELFTFISDLSNQEGCLNFANYVKSLNREITVLVNNAGKFEAGPMMTEGNDVLESQMATNVYSAYYVTKYLWDNLKKAQRSHVFNICSIASITAYAAGGSYSVSKHALLGFSKSLRLEGIPFQVNVTALLPGATLTDSWSGVDLPETRFMRPEDVAKVVFNAWDINEYTVVEEVLLRPLLGDV